jgi:hypothetical protein
LTASNLALALSGQGKHDEAEAMHRETLAVQQRVLGLEHPDTLFTASVLALALSGQGKCVEAEKVYRETLAVQQRVLGPEHPSTVKTAKDLAACMHALCSLMAGALAPSPVKSDAQMSRVLCPTGVTLVVCDITTACMHISQCILSL